MSVEQRTAAVLGALLGDSLALGAHWEYDSKKLAETHGRVDQLKAPALGSYHAGKRAGEFTHYGDQTMVLLESVSEKNGFDLDNFFLKWQDFFSDYTGYVDGATRNTLQRIEFGEGAQTCGSNSNDLAGASRIAPLVYAYADDVDALVMMARAQTMITHNQVHVMDVAEYFARATAYVLHGARPVQAMEKAAGHAYESDVLPTWVELGLKAKDESVVSATGKLGQTCHVDEAFACVVQNIARYETDLKNALIECVMAGGDSAARALPVGMILGASQQAGGMGALPKEWLEALVQGQRIKELLAKISGE